ncbi:hypothetical protein [Saccharothrix xinjiangensis]|uniref:Uncharacterized protein n=1 Tax=Saccharothrix xinjiangensis TaxID=204798 RepID=A0ABV9YAD2_9PSEU
MTDFIALCGRRPEPRDTATALLAAGPGFGVDRAAHGALLRILAEDDRPLVVVEGPLLVQVPGEPARLLGPELAGLPAPVWWVEARAEWGGERAAGAARRFATELAARTGGVVWPCR